MLRRVARVLRYLLLTAGCVLLVLIPITWSPVPYVVLSNTMVGISNGSVQCIFDEPASELSIDVGFLDANHWRAICDYQASPVWPALHRGQFYGIVAIDVTVVTIPLWLLAFLCLAWPVTSLLLARRRGKGRGFAVEAGAECQRPASTLHPAAPTTSPRPD